MGHFIPNIQKLLQTHIKEMFGIIYTPTEADAIQNYSRLFRKPEGCFLSIDEADKVDESLASFSGQGEIDYIVVSDGEQVRHSRSAQAIPAALTFLADFRDRRPGRGCHFDIGGQVGRGDGVRRNISLETAPCGA